MKQYHVRKFPNFVNELKNNPQVNKLSSSRQFKDIMKSYGYDVEVYTGDHYGTFYMDDVNATLFILRWL